MSEMQIPFPLKGIPLKPEMAGRVKVDETLIQSLSALCGWDGEARRLLTCAVNGSLHTTSPQVKSLINKVSTEATQDITFGSIATTEVLIMANAANTGIVWVNFSIAAAVDTGWPLAGGDNLNISINNLSDLRLHVVTSGDKVIIIYTV